ncbi:MAG: glycoside hydrolase family protein [Carboxylicivirga sp.]|jgi:beta-xylosidase|nr:glycoside hydrolase family protein [Carboxylicivirga sp.]
MMRLFKTIGFISWMLLSFSCDEVTERKPIEDFSTLMQAVSRNSVLAEDGYYVWGGSVVKGDDGKYHMFYSRWKEEYGFEAWVTHSEIAHAIAERPEGPFKFHDVTLPARDAVYWDGLTTHNPTIHKFDGKYYLYYMGTTGDGEAMRKLNFSHRNNQRIGLAWADNPNGPWHRSDKPLIDVSDDEKSHDALMVSNPSLTQMKDGKILMIYKAVAKKNALPFGGPVSHLAAIADSPAGPFKKLNQRIFYEEGQKFPAEDPSIWYDKKVDTYYAIVKDMKGAFTKRGTSLAFFTSKDGLNWAKAEQALASTLQINWEDGIQKVTKLERPQILLENGCPIMLYCSVSENNPFQEPTYNVHIPLKTIHTNQER